MCLEVMVERISSMAATMVKRATRSVMLVLLREWIRAVFLMARE